MLLRLVPRSISLFSNRAEHFLAGVPLKKRGVDGLLPVDHFKDKLILVYFGAGWCGSCKFLTKKLKKLYEGLGDKSNELEIVWVSGDKEAQHQLDYYEKAMPDWAYIPFGDPNIKGFADKFGVSVLPGLKLVSAEGKILNDKPRVDVEECVKKDPASCIAKWNKLK